MRIEVTHRSTAGPTAVWEILADLPRWPRWCPAFLAVEPDGPLAAGARVRVLRPGLRPVTWTVDRVVEGSCLRWSSRGPGFATVAERRVLSDRTAGAGGTPGTAAAGAGTIIRVSLAVTGPMAWAVSLISRRPMLRYLRAEVRDLARAAEAGGR